MFEALAAKPDPIVFLIAGFPLALIVLAVAYRVAVALRRAFDAQGEAAYGMGQAAIFTLIALILGFSFAFAADRYEARRALVGSEADALGSAYLRSALLPDVQRDAFRRTLIAYGNSRLDTYASIGDMHAESAALARDKQLHDQLWTIATRAALADRHDTIAPLVATSVNDVISIADKQTAALDSHVPTAIFGLVVLCALTGVTLLGVTFGRARAPHFVLALALCMLFSATVFTIADLDHAHGGLIQLDVTTLRTVVDGMKQS